MSTISAILTPASDGTLHLPLPMAWRHQPIRVKAELEPVATAPSATISGTSDLKGFGCLKGKIWIAPDFNEPLEDFKEYM